MDELIGDPMEAIIAEALDRAGIAYTRDHGGGNPSGLDFRLANGVEIEVKRMHSPRIAEQMARAENVIAIQGDEAVRWFAVIIAALERLEKLEGVMVAVAKGGTPTASTIATMQVKQP